MAELELSGVSKTYGAFNALKDVSLEIGDGEFAVFVGPSGCGKSTLLRLIAGLDPVSEGQIAIGGKDVTSRQAGQRPIAMVFQNYALYPHMSVYDNIAFPLQMERRPKDEIRAEVAKAAQIVQLSTRLQDKPSKLSGGQRQRVAIARAIVRKPGIFLMDEPLSNLDAALRMEMRSELTQLHRRLGSTMVYVTHDQLEAMTMADRIVVLNGGKVEQVGPPMELYHNPANLFVAGFIGSPPMNFLAGTVRSAEGATVSVEAARIGVVTLPFSGEHLYAGDSVTLGIRPEALELGAGRQVQFSVVPEAVERLGLHTIVHAGEEGRPFTALFNGDPKLRAGEAINVSVDGASVKVFDADGILRSRRAEV
ncbi:sugar ABC transporter ATP-binding protein [Devosia sp. Leaf420]|uniref:ABC transporter ATP-binding protein n=1 Tax=Devosia sp. Leaf420 TaxID=1736374 RepID=UPI00071362F7|nr:ABC transporter ATP-binding protein [Devosia sp. Leaf420]KQT41928.1 sugar ABC transporter ATP-binding protein [Devosia sp. Leaf420]